MTALEALPSVVLVVTQRMLEFDVKVCSTLLTKCSSLVNSVIWSCNEEAVHTYWLVWFVCKNILDTTFSYF